MGVPNLSTPTYFPAVSSTCSVGPPEELLRLLSEAAYPRVLVSAYDCRHKIGGDLSKAATLVSTLRRAGCTVLLDSGIFECQVLGITDWSAKEYAEVAGVVPHDLHLSYDGPTTERDHRERLNRPEPLLNIIHGGDRQGIVTKTRQAGDDGSVSGVAIPDRECGPNLLERVRTLSAIRHELNRCDELLLLHVLGCGNPVVMASYALAGADSFDSLDWVQGAVDVRTLTVTDPILLGSTGCKCGFCSDLPGPDRERAILHNLLFYQDFGVRLRQMIQDRTVQDFLQEFVGKERAEKVVKAVTEVEAGQLGANAR